MEIARVNQLLVLIIGFPLFECRNIYKSFSIYGTQHRARVDCHRDGLLGARRALVSHRRAAGAECGRKSVLTRDESEPPMPLDLIGVEDFSQIFHSGFQPNR